MADSGDSSPHSAAATDDAHHEGSEAAAAQAAPPPPAPPAKVRLMVSYGGRIQPRPHDHQLSYVNGETKILSLERPLRFADFASRLAGLAGSPGDFCVKYQLPGEDLDALVSVTNDEDLEHLVLEYDRLHLLRPAPGSGGGSSRGGSTPRLRVFLFPVQSPTPPPPPQPSGLLEPKQEQRQWFVDALNSVHQPPPPSPPQPKQESVSVQSPPPAVVPMPQPPPVLPAPTGPDYLFGLDNGFVPPPAVKVKDPAGDPPTVKDNVPVEIPAKNDDRHTTNPVSDHVVVSPVVSPGEFQRQIQGLEKLQFADTAAQQPPPPPAPATAAPPPAALPRNGSDDSLTRAYPPATVTPTPPTATPEYYLPKYQEKPAAPPPSSAPPPTAFLPVPGRYTSVAPGSGADHAPVFFIPAPPHGYFTTAAGPGATSFPAVYAVAQHNGNANASGNGPSPAAASNAQAYAPQVAYDSNGRAIYYTSVLPQYASAVSGVPAAATVLGTDPAKPVAVKPTVS